MKGHNICDWTKVGETTLCGKSCFAALTVRFTWQRFVKAVRFRGPVNLVEEAYRVIYNYAAPVVEIRFGVSI